MQDLIVRVLSGEASEDDIRRLEAWRAASPDNERAYAELQRVWHATSPDAGPGIQIPAAPTLSLIVAEAERRRKSVVSIGAWRARRVRWWPISVAAAAAAVILVSIGIGRSWRQSHWVYATGADEQRTVTLADGSIVRLGPESELRGRNGSPRSVHLEGRAFLAVASDSAGAFTVETPVGRTVVLGTRFEIATGADSLRLVVVEGRVALSSSTGGTPVEVARGQMSRVLRGSGPSAPVAVDVWELFEWPNGVLIFQATPLGEVMQEIAEHFGVNFSISDADLAQRTVTAWFEDEPLADVVNTVCAVVGAHCTVGDTVEVSP